MLILSFVFRILYVYWKHCRPWSDAVSAGLGLRYFLWHIFARQDVLLYAIETVNESMFLVRFGLKDSLPFYVIGKSKDISKPYF